MEQYNCTVVDLGYYNSEKFVLIEVNEDSDEIEMGKKPSLNQIVCIWDYADIDLFPNTKMQLEFAYKWYECKKQ